VLVVLLLPVLLGFATLAVDLANAFIHSRNLQTQADAAALAGAETINYQQGTVSGCDDSNVLPTVQSYQLKNEPLGNGTVTSHLATSNGQPAINQPQYYDSPSNPKPSDDSPTGSPCSTGVVDVKLTETNVSLFFHSLNIGPFRYINGHARAAILTRTSAINAVPIGIASNTPQEARVWLIDETGGACAGSKPCVLGSAPLSSADSTNWSTSALPVTFTHGTGDQTSLVVALSGNPPGKLAPDLATACSQSLVVCYDQSSGKFSSQGIDFIRSYANIADAYPSAPVVARDVELTNPPCGAPDPYFSVPCAVDTAGVQATLDFGPKATVDQTKDVTLSASVDTTNNVSVPMVYNKGLNQWSTKTATVPLASGGPNNISLTWTATNGKLNDGTDCSKNNNKSSCTGTLTNVQRAYVQNSTRSGPIQSAQVSVLSSPAGSPATDGHSFSRCAATDATTACSYTLGFTIGIGGTLANDTNPMSKPYELVSTGNSQTGFLQCDPTGSNSSANGINAIAQGCTGVDFAVNDGAAPWNNGCPAANQFASFPQPWECAAVNTGLKATDIPAGLNARIFCGGNATNCNPTSCTSPNWWSDPNKGIAGQIATADPRVVTVFVVPFGTFSGGGSNPSGQASYPIQAFGNFYITAWNGTGQNSNPCEPAAAGTPPDDPPLAGAGEVWGHFFKQISPGDGNGKTQCVPNQFSGCIIRLTR
jgi:hypothetical protein